MPRKIMSSDLSSTDVSGSSWAKDLFSGKAGKAANQSGEKKRLYGYFQKAYKESGGNTTVAIAKTMGYLKKDPEFSGSEILQVKSGLKEKGYFVPGYSLSPEKEKKAAENKTSEEPSSSRSWREEIRAKGREKQKESMSLRPSSEKKSFSIFQSRPRF